MAALLAGAGMTKTYRVAAQATDTRAVDSEETLVDAKGVDGELPEEFTRVYDLDADTVIVMEKEGTEIVENFINIDWTLRPGETGMIPEFSKEADDMISIMIVGEPDDISYQMGVKDSNELIRYVEGRGHLSYDFSVTEHGEYCFLVTNLDGSRDLQIKGTVIE